MKRIHDYFSTLDTTKRANTVATSLDKRETCEEMPVASVQNTLNEQTADKQDNMQEDVAGPSKSHVVYSRLDVGVFEDTFTTTDQEKFEMLKNCWVPDAMYKFPASERNLKFQHKWLQEFNWLAYSRAHEGAYCKFCKIFGARFDVGKGTHVTLGVLVKTPLKKWKKAKEEFRNHEAREYHKLVVQKVANFLAVHENRTVNITEQVDKGSKSKIEENRKKLSPIIKTVIFCGREGLPLRGHRDSGPLEVKTTDEDEGKFRALLKFRVESGDQLLQKHLEIADKNATYLSPRIQNEIIETCGNILLSTIVNRVKNSSVFSVLADETADISGIEQFSINVRYVDEVGGLYIIREDFLKFLPVVDTRGTSLSHTIIQCLGEIGLDPNNLRGMGFDGASNMSGQFSGCAAKVREVYPQAVYVHCASHSLNLALSQACTVPGIKNCLGTMRSIITFFRKSSKRESVLRKNIGKMEPESKKKRLIKFCETRWVEHLDAISLFVELYKVIKDSLVEIQDFTDSEASSKAFALTSAIQTPVFILGMCIANTVFSLSRGLAVLLQSKQSDIETCVKFCKKL